MAPVAMLNTPTCFEPVGTTRCSDPVAGVDLASANGYGAGSVQPRAASAPACSSAAPGLARERFASSTPRPLGGRNGLGMSMRGAVGSMESSE